MKNFIPIDEQVNKTSTVIDFLDSLDTDVTSSVPEEVVQSEDIDNNAVSDVEESKEEITALVVTKPNSLFVAQTMFKKSIKISIKSFLISLSLGFLNLFF